MLYLLLLLMHLILYQFDLYYNYLIILMFFIFPLINKMSNKMLELIEIYKNLVS